MKIGMYRRALLPSLAVMIMACSVSGRLGDTALAAASDSGASSYVLMVFNDAIDGKDVEFNDWYDHVHSKEVTNELRFDHAQRFGASSVVMGNEAPRHYVILYSGTSEDLDKTYMDYYINAAKEPPGPPEIKPGTNYNDSLRQVGPEIKGRGPSMSGGGAAQSYLWFVYADPVGGKDVAFDHWFNGDFARAMATVPGIVSAQPYVRTKAQLGANHGPAVPPPHLILFRIRTDNLAAVMSAAKQKQDALQADNSDTAVPGLWVSFGFKELGPIIRP